MLRAIIACRFAAILCSIFHPLWAASPFSIFYGSQPAESQQTSSQDDEIPELPTIVHATSVGHGSDAMAAPNPGVYIRGIDDATLATYTQKHKDNLHRLRYDKDTRLAIVNWWYKSDKYTGSAALRTDMSAIGVVSGIGKMRDFDKHALIFQFFKHYYRAPHTPEPQERDAKDHEFVICLSYIRHTGKADISIPWHVVSHPTVGNVNGQLLSETFFFVALDNAFMGTIRFFKTADKRSVLNSRMLCRFTSAGIAASDASRTDTMVQMDVKEITYVTNSLPRESLSMMQGR